MSTNLNTCKLLKVNSTISLIDIVSHVENNQNRVNVVIIINKITAIGRTTYQTF